MGEDKVINIMFQCGACGFKFTKHPNEIDTNVMGERKSTREHIKLSTECPNCHHILKLVHLGTYG